jgi:hypothetical protein
MKKKIALPTNTLKFMQDFSRLLTRLSGEKKSKKGQKRGVKIHAGFFEEKVKKGPKTAFLQKKTSKTGQILAFPSYRFWGFFEVSKKRQKRPKKGPFSGIFPKKRQKTGRDTVIYIRGSWGINKDFFQH